MPGMRRREFVALLGGAAAASLVWPRDARAAAGDAGHRLLQRPIARCRGTDTCAVPEGIGGVWIRGWRNVAIEYRFAEGQDERLPELAAELVRRQVAMLVATDRPSALAAKAATATIPIVFTSGFDPVQLGLVASFNRPGAMPPV